MCFWRPKENKLTKRKLLIKLIVPLCIPRVSKQADENKMNASNLGIIFGPTLVKPRQIDAEVSLSSLVDYPCQALMVEMMVRHFHMIFDAPTPFGSEITTTSAQASPRLTQQEKVRQLSRHSTSLMDIKEVRRTLMVQFDSHHFDIWLNLICKVAMKDVNSSWNVKQHC